MNDPRRVGFRSAVRRGILLVLLVGLVMGAASLPSGNRLRAAEPTVSAGLSDGNGCGDTAAAVCTLLSARKLLSAEEQLAEKYAPVVFLKAQVDDCSDDGEPYMPAPVEVVLGDPDVVLRQDAGGDSAADDPVIIIAPTAKDLIGRDDSYYLDFPGNPRGAGCDYETWFNVRMGTQSPVTYVHIATEPERPEQLAVQFWFFYVFNNFNNTHESDWEMVQLTFDATSAAEALSQEPSKTAFAQHGGAEGANWNDEKISKEGNHIIVYPAAGSHASQYGSHVYLGWGENGTGFGCDNSEAPSVPVSLQPVLVPNAPDPDGPFAWLLFEGRWGEKQPWEFNGPLGPNLGSKWTLPISWTDNIRESSLKIPEFEGIGPSPASVFCALSSAGAQVLIYFGIHPAVVIAGIAAFLLLIALLFFIARSYFRPAWNIYRKHRRTFGLIGLFAIPIGVAINALEYFIVRTPPVEWALSWVGDNPVSRLILVLLAAGVQHLLMLAVIGPGVIEAMTDVQNGQEPGVRRSYRVVRDRLGRLVRALFRSTAIVTCQVLTIVGVPWAIRNVVRWRFFGQAAIVDDVPSGRLALDESARVVKGAWWQTLGIGTAFTLLATAPGPLLGILCLVIASASVGFVNVLSSFIFVFTIPYSIIGATLLYQRLRDCRILSEPMTVSAD